MITYSYVVGVGLKPELDSLESPQSILARKD
jgi:hypothetical protein